MTASIDLDSLTKDDPPTKKVGIEFDDDGNPTVGFIIVSKDSAQYVNTAHLLRSAAIKRQSNKSQKLDTKTDAGAQALDQVLQENELALALAVTVGWFGFTHKGEPAPYTHEAGRNAYTKRPTWREKVTAALEAESGFLPS